MQASDAQAGYGDFVQQAIALADVEANRPNGPRRTLVVTIGNVDLPAFVSRGRLYIQAPLPKLFEAFAEDISEFLSDLEVGVSATGRASLSSASFRRPISGAAMARARLVQRRRIWR